MRQKDIVLIIVVVFMSAVGSFFLSNKLFASPKDRQAQVEVVQAISDEFHQPSKKYFNSQSVDPTQLIRIGANKSSQPFNSTSN